MTLKPGLPEIEHKNETGVVRFLDHDYAQIVMCLDNHSYLAQRVTQLLVDYKILPERRKIDGCKVTFDALKDGDEWRAVNVLPFPLQETIESPRPKKVPKKD